MSDITSTISILSNKDVQYPLIVDITKESYEGEEEEEEEEDSNKDIVDEDIYNKNKDEDINNKDKDINKDINKDIILHVSDISNSVSSTLTNNEIFINSSRICSICLLQISKYTCPKCNISYCTILCYKKHNNNCVLQFENNNINELLKNNKINKKNKMDMINILKRNNYSNNDKVIENKDIEYNEDEYNKMIDHLSKLIVEDKLSYDELPNDIKNEIIRSAKYGDLGKFLQIKLPWWDIHSEFNNNKESNNKPIKFLIHDVNNPDPFTPPFKPADIKPFLTIYSKDPSPYLILHIIELIYYYTYLYSFYGNGIGFIDDNIAQSEVANYFVSYCKTFANANFTNLSQVLNFCLETVSTTSDIFSSLEFSLFNFKHVTQILYHKISIVYALYHIRELFYISKKFKKSQLKLDFMISWVNDQVVDRFEDIGDDVWNFYLSKQALKDSENNLTTNIKTHN